MTAVRRLVRRTLLLLFVSWIAVQASELRILGPEGGDVRRLAYVPGNPDRIFLGTSSGRLYVSNDAGASWSQFAHLGQGFDYVLDNIAIDPRDDRTMYVAAWSIENSNGELFRTRDGGRTWTSLKAMQGKSIRSLAMAPSDSRIIFAGALDGVFRSNDRGETWTRISPPNHVDIKNIESLSVDPKNPDIVYAGTWHLAWKTSDGGANWKQINRGMIDDSDVFSIIVDPDRPNVVYASACSGIYKSETAGELFAKVQGIPSSARRTRVLKQDPKRSDVVYAGTTEGLWRTMDAGHHWQRISPPNWIVNDVMVDPRDSARVLVATDRSGVLMTTNDGRSFSPSNRGFSHRQVTAVLVDRRNPEVVYAGVVNDKEFGGVFISRDSGARWMQISAGLAGEDVFALTQDKSGQIYAGTNRGLFRFSEKSQIWMRIYPAVRSQFFHVAAMQMDGSNWILVGPAGIAHTHNAGRAWFQERNPSKQRFMAVQAAENLVATATHDLLLTSSDGGRKWNRAHYPTVSYIRSMALDKGSRIWITSPQGAFYRDVDGDWEKVTGLPETPLMFSYDQQAHRMLAVTAGNAVFASADSRKWERVMNLGVPTRTLAPARDQVFVGTQFDGVLSFDLGAKAASAKLDGGK